MPTDGFNIPLNCRVGPNEIEMQNWTNKAFGRPQTKRGGGNITRKRDDLKFSEKKTTMNQSVPSGGVRTAV